MYHEQYTPAMALREFQHAVHEKTGDYRQRLGQTYDPTSDTAKLRRRLILEEAQEFVEALNEYDEEHALKEFCDLLYVVYGTAVCYGWNIAPAFMRVHNNNLSKVRNGTVNEFGKLVKPEDHPKVILTDLVS